MNQKIMVEVLLPLNHHQQLKLQSACPEASFHFTNAQDITIEELTQATCFIGNPTLAQLPLMKNARFLQLNTAGSDTYAQQLHSSCLLCNATGAYHLAISEFLIGMTLSLYLHLAEYRMKQALHCWENQGQVRSIANSKVLVVGFGDIGEAYAHKMHLLGAKITGIRSNTQIKPDYVEHMGTLQELDQMLPSADIVVSVLPQSPQTTHTFTLKQFQLMKKTAIFLNVGRGSAVVSEDLLRALQSNMIAGAALDVFEEEPLPVHHPLWDCPNLLITPHIAGGFNLEATLDTILEISIHNLNAYLHDEPCINQVDRQTGYRKL